MLIIRERVRFVETDMMNVVHHANYFNWFEMGRVEYLNQAGVQVNDLVELGYLFPITDVRCNYRKSARFGDDILICTQLIELSRAKLVFAYKIRLAKDQSILAEGLSQNIFTKIADNSATRLPTEIYQKLKSFQDANMEGSDNV